MIEDWRKAIVEMFNVKQELRQNDLEEVFPFHLPRVAAKEEMIAETEKVLGYRLDESYRNFLKYSNGWKGFFHTVDLFGTDELVNSPIMKHALETLDIIDDVGVIECSGYRKEELLPIAATMLDKDLFVMVKPDSINPGKIIWFAGEEIDRFKNFEEFYFSMIEYNKETIQDLENSKKGNK